MLTGYFGNQTVGYSFIPENTTKININIKENRYRASLFLVDNGKWVGIVNGRIFYNSLEQLRTDVCKRAEKEPLPSEAYKERAILDESKVSH